MVSFRVRNLGKRDGKDVPQVYVSPVAGGWEAPKRLVLSQGRAAPGASTDVELRVDPALARGVQRGRRRGWRIAKGVYKALLGSSAAALPLETSIQLPERTLPVGSRPK